MVPALANVEAIHETEMMVEEGIRLVCPGCDLAYRLKRLRPGKTYHCKECGSVLAMADGSPLSTAPSRSNRDAPHHTERGGDLARLPGLIADLTARLEAVKGEEDEASPGENALATLEERVATLAGELEGRLNGLDARTETIPAGLDAVMRRLDGVEESVGERLLARFGEMEARLAALAEKTPDSEALASLRDEVHDAGRSFQAAVDSIREESGRERLAVRTGIEGLRESAAETRRELASLLKEAERERSGATVEVNIDELADRLVAGIRGASPLFDTETGTVVDTLARLADELVKEQGRNSKRLDSLASEIHQATIHISRIDEWRSELPSRVADEIGATVEERVVGPIAGALSRQAPAILSGLQDSKLVDIVSRSVREAQRPLLREILSGGRGGLPWWSFFSLLVPLLLILGYLYLPGDETSVGERIGGVREELLAGQDEIIGILLDAAEGKGAGPDRYAGLETAVRNIGEDAIIHARENARLEEEAKALRASIDSLEKAMEEYKAVVVRQDARLRQYERRLIQLGVVPETVGD